MASPTQRAGILFDLDGTLVDTNYLHTLAWARALLDVGEWAPMNAIHRLVGMGGEQLVPTLLDREVAGASDARARRYEELMSEVRSFPGAAELLGQAHDAGLAVVIATSSPGDELEPALTALRAGRVIDLVTSADEVSNSKPDPEVFVEAMRAGSIDPAVALAVGDSVWDVRAARAAGIGCVAVETGGFSRHELSESGAIAVYRDVDELRRQFWTSPLGLLARS
jgi:HAD superfamily hydrolase (TIGR01509 family)